MSTRAIAAILLAALAVAIYARGVANGFALDDRTDLLENRFVTGPLDVTGIFTSEYYGGWGYLASGHYRPLLNLTYKIVADLFGLRPLPFHLLNVVLFALLVGLTVRVVGRIAGDDRVGIVAGAIFAVHPIASESVAAIVGLKEIAAAGLSVCALALHARRGATSRIRPIAVAGLVLAACFFKETALAFVPIALAAEFLRREAPRPSGARDALRRASSVWPFVAGVGVALLTRALVTGGLFRATVVYSVDNPLVLLPEPFRAIAASTLLPRYLALWLWPSCLSADYSEGALRFPSSLGDPLVLASVLLAALLVLALVWSVVRGARVLAFGLVAFGCSYLLVSNLVLTIGTAMAERLFFVPSWGLAIAAAAVLVDGADRIAEATSRRSPRTAPILVVSAGVLLLASLTARTIARVGDWKDNERLAASVLACHPDNMKVLIVRAERERAAGHRDEAQRLLRRALEVRRNSPYALAALGVHLLETGETERGIELLTESASSAEPIPGAVLRIALHYRDAGRDAEAFRFATRALESRPSFVDAATARIIRGGVFLTQGHLLDAETEYRLALRDDPDRAVTHFNLGRCLDALGRPEEALRALGRAEALAPRDPRPIFARAVVEAKLGRTDTAAAALDRVLAIDPDFQPARQLRAQIEGTSRPDRR